jgi:hypothetical protein
MAGTTLAKNLFVNYPTYGYPNVDETPTLQKPEGFRVLVKL